MAKKIKPIHPGEILLEDLMVPYGISQNKLGKDLGISPRRINEIVHGKRGITADTALRLARFFSMSPDFWMGLQAEYDLAIDEQRTAKSINQNVKVWKHTKKSPPVNLQFAKALESTFSE